MKARLSAAAERTVIESAQKDPRQFAELYQDNVDLVYAYIIKRVRDRDQAEDLTSDVFHSALKNLACFEWRGVPFAAWLLKIASNAIADHSKRAARERGTAIADPVDEHADNAFHEAEHRAKLFQSVEALPADQRRVVAMRFGEQKNIREIAAELCRSEGAIKQLQFRGLSSLRKAMGKKNG